MSKKRVVRILAVLGCFCFVHLGSPGRTGVQQSAQAEIAPPEDREQPADFDAFQAGYREETTPDLTLPGQEDAQVRLPDAQFPPAMRAGSAEAHALSLRRHQHVGRMGDYAAALRERAARIELQRIAGTEVQP